METMEIKNVEYYRTHCGAAGIAITFSDDSKHLISAYSGCSDTWGDTYECDNCGHWYGCVFEQAESADYKCGWEEAEELLKQYTAEPVKPVTNEELDELLSQFA